MEFNMGEIEKALAGQLAPVQAGITANAEELKAMRKKQEEIEEKLDSAKKAKAEAEKTTQGDGVKELIAAMTGQDANPEYEKPGPGIRLARQVRAMAYVRKAGMSVERVPEILKNRYHDPVTAELVQKAMNVGTPSGGGYLVPEPIAAEIIPLLQASARVLQAGARTLPMPNGNLSFRKVTGAPTATYRGESAVIAKTGVTLGDMNMVARSLGAIVPVTNELLGIADVAVDQLVLEELIRAFALRMDLAALAGTGISDTPIGILYTLGISTVTMGAVPTPDTTLSFEEALESANVDLANCSWIMNPKIKKIYKSLKSTTGQYLFKEEMNAGRLEGYPLFTSTQIALGAAAHYPSVIYFGDFSQLYWGRTGEMKLDFSSEASYTDASSALVSSFEKNETLIRAIDMHDFGVRQPSAFCVCSDAWIA